ncbi:MAG: nitrilase family protein [Muribaculaceae bacterium]|nr:nitrilase family protein [Muribaculaceae bacterium]
MADILPIAAIELDIVWADPKENLRRVSAILDQLPADIELVVLPEMFSTGFIADRLLLQEVVKEHTAPTLAALKGMAESRSLAIAGSMVAGNGDGKVYNRGFFITPDGREMYYDKRHLFRLSAENSLYTGGENRPPVISYQGWNISMIVCFDLRFPVWSRNTEEQYDCLLVPANWPQVREYAWEHLLIARAIENQAVIVGANRGGTDDFGTYDGLSYIFDEMGKPVYERLKDVPAVVSRPSLSKIKSFREHLPITLSADRFDIK